MNTDELKKNIAILVLVIIASIMLVRYLSGGETLKEYADKNNIPVHEVTEEENK